MEIPVPIPNTEVKHVTSWVLVSERKRSPDAVFFYFLNMKSPLTKSQAKQKIEAFFKTKTFTPEQLKKIKRLAMRYKIRLGPLRKTFCKSCLNPLRGKTRITKTHRTTECKSCQTKNRHKLG